LVGWLVYDVVSSELSLLLLHLNIALLSVALLKGLKIWRISNFQFPISNF